MTLITFIFFTVAYDYNVSPFAVSSEVEVNVSKHTNLTYTNMDYHIDGISFFSWLKHSCIRSLLYKFLISTLDYPH